MSVKERIDTYLKEHGISGCAFEKSIGKSRGWWSSCRNPTAGNVEKILEMYPDLSSDWVMRGRGEMLEELNILQESYDAGLERYYKALIDMKNERIAQLEEQIALLKAKAV